jgi:hypothetical protein
MNLNIFQNFLCRKAVYRQHPTRNTIKLNKKDEKRISKKKKATTVRSASMLLLSEKSKSLLRRNQSCPHFHLNHGQLKELISVEKGLSPKQEKHNVDVHKTFLNKRQKNLQIFEGSRMRQTKIFGNSSKRGFNFNPSHRINASQSNKEISRKNQLSDRKLKNTFSCEFLFPLNGFSKTLMQTNKKGLSFLDTDNKIKIVDEERPVLNETIHVDNDIAHSEAEPNMPQPITATNSSNSHRSETTTNEVNQIR